MTSDFIESQKLTMTKTRKFTDLTDASRNFYKSEFLIELAIFEQKWLIAKRKEQSAMHRSLGFTTN